MTDHELEGLRLRYHRSILFLVVILVGISLANTLFTVVLTIGHDESTTERTDVTQEVVITVAACLMELPRPTTEKDIRECVAEHVRDQVPPKSLGNAW